MRLGVFTIFLLLAGAFIPESEVSAGVIKSPDKLDGNYAIHQRFIVYNNLSSYRNRGPAPNKYDVDLVRQPASVNNISASGFPEAESPFFSNGISSKNQTYSDILKIPVTLISGENPTTRNQQNDVGTFLDNFKSDPLLKTIYFSSKDLIFSYQKKTANILQLEFDMDADENKNFKGPVRNTSKITEKSLTQIEKKKLKHANKSLFLQISESYKTILYIILAIFGTIFLSFRYILNRYI